MKRWLLAGSICTALLCILCLLVCFWPAEQATEIEKAVRESVLEAESDEASEGGRASESGKPSEETEDAASDYISPVDFEALKELSPDIYAWLHIPGTEISYPVVQHKRDDSFYLNHNVEGAYDKNGALFTEHAYNTTDFYDPVTLVYGHHMKSGAMFGNLQKLYSGPDALEKYRDIFVYLPEEELHYTVFAAVPFSSQHILYYNDFSDPDQYEAFVEQIYSVRAIGKIVDEEAEVTPDDRLLILSTCLSGNSDKRYLVLAKRT